MKSPQSFFLAPNQHSVLQRRPSIGVGRKLAQVSRVRMYIYVPDGTEQRFDGRSDRVLGASNKSPSTVREGSIRRPAGTTCAKTKNEASEGSIARSERTFFNRYYSSRSTLQDPCREIYKTTSNPPRGKKELLCILSSERQFKASD